MNQILLRTRISLGFLFLFTVLILGETRKASGAVPVITSGSTATASLGYAFNYQIAASDSPTLFDATGLPAGLNVDTATGLISGTPSSTGTYASTINACNVSGTGTAQLTITVLPGATSLTWLGGFSNDWFDGRNWTGHFVPRSIDTVYIATGTVTASESASFAAMTLNGGTIDASLTVSGSMVWNGGTIKGVVTVLSGGSINLSYGPLTLTGTINNSGLVTTGSNNYSTVNMQLGGQGLVNNQAGGLFSIAGSSGLNVSGTTNSAFSNAGTLLCTSYSGINLTRIGFNNTGLVDMQAGTFSSDIGFVTSGTMTTAAGGFSPPSILLSGTVSGNLNASNNVVYSQGVGGDFTVSGTLNWWGGTISGLVMVPSGGAINLLGSSPPLSLTGTLNNSGTIGTGSNNYSTASLELRGQGKVNNQTGGLFSIAGSYGLNVSGTTNSAFSNAGTVRCASYSGIYLASIGFNNTGLVDLQSGNISFDSVFSQSAGSLSLSGVGVSVQSTLPMQISGGIIIGNGTINGSIYNSGGMIKPGNALGSLTINGAYTQTGSGMLDLEISGTAPGTGYDQLAITGQASLGGTLRVSLINGFQPSAGQSYSLFSYGSLASNTLAFNLPVFGGLLFSKTFSATQFTLDVYGSAFAKWKHDKFGTDADNPAVSGDKVVNNGAGIINLMAYALGLDPFTASASDLPVSAIKNYSGSDYLSFTFNRDPTATDLTYTVEVNSSLNNPDGWTALATSVNGADTSGPGLVSETDGDPIVSVEVRDTQPVGSANRRFIRLNVTH